jgi:RimJ/RimL family protein N-acetyltransferase
VIRTSRLVLRPPRPDDLDALSRVFGDPKVMRLVGAGRALGPSEVEAMVDRMVRFFAADGFGQLAVVRVADGRVIGRVGLLPLDPETWRPAPYAELGPSAAIELGWALVRDAWGLGYAFEAAAAVVDWARGPLGLLRLVSIVQHGNERSARLAERLGERFERDIVTSFGRPARLYGLELRPPRLPDAAP